MMYTNDWNAFDAFLANKISVIFHVHIPEEIGKTGHPVVLCTRKESGSSIHPIVKLRRPFQNQNPTYWQSDLVTISLPNVTILPNLDEIRYTYAINIAGWLGRDENLKFEPRASRKLDTKINGQFDIWGLKTSQLDDCNIRDFAFVKYIYNTVETNNLENSVMEYQNLLVIHRDNAIRESDLKFITDHIDNKSREKQLFLCLLLGYHVLRQGTFYELPDQFPSRLFLDALKSYKRDMIIASNVDEQMHAAIVSLVRHNAFQMQFDWLIIFEVVTEIDPNYTFVEHLRGLRYSDDLLAKFVEKAEIIKHYIFRGIEVVTYVRLAEVNFIPLKM